jgi:hypothetical protein
MVITLNNIHIFIILMLALVCASCLGKYITEGFNSNSNTDSYSDKYDMLNRSTIANSKSTKAKVTPSKDLDDSADNIINLGYSPNVETPLGVPASQIPPGQNDMYVLKSEVIPPVCPACPEVVLSEETVRAIGKKCPPCPPCARCPEPSFECKKVPNYSSVMNGTNDMVPKPLMAEFVTFGR